MSPKTDVWTVYVRLWGRAEGLWQPWRARTASVPELFRVGAFVHYEQGGSAGESGWFVPNDAEDPPRPEIAIIRGGPPAAPRGNPTRLDAEGTVLPDDFLEDELCTLAHEIGHFKSWRRGERTAAYQTAVNAFWRGERLTSERQALITAEEERAWAYARDELKDLGFFAWPRFDSKREIGLQGWAARMAK